MINLIIDQPMIQDIMNKIVAKAFAQDKSTKMVMEIEESFRALI